MDLIRTKELFAQMNELGRKRCPFAFLIDAFAEQGIVFQLDDPSDAIFWDFPFSNHYPSIQTHRKLKTWEASPIDFNDYLQIFNRVQKHIRHGNTFLLNLTCQTRLKCNLSLEELFLTSRARYRVYFREVFTCFSPEPFIRIINNEIHSCPMKGTAFISSGTTEKDVLENRKEMAEHSTIVDLIRNDISRIATKVTVERFRYTEKIVTPDDVLIQVSSLIKGTLPVKWPDRIGDILSETLPAGSVTGAPKPRTIEIIRKTENYERGWYTGIFGIFDGKSLDSAVLIRFVEDSDGALFFKSGGGITHLSDANREYEEMVKKIYVPIG